MTPIPGEPHRPSEPEFNDKDGRKLKIKVPGLAPRAVPRGTEERGAAEPPRDDPRPLHNPNHGTV
jgi:hypothetical protein